jgi:subtilisin family serine protease
MSTFASNKLSFETYLFLQQGGKNTTHLQSQTSVNVFLKVDDSYDLDLVTKLGGKELVKTKTISLVSIPIENIVALSELPFVQYVDIEKQIKPNLNIAMQSVNADDVHSGIGLERSYMGEGVILGIIDIGVDFTHTFLLDEYGRSRVQRAWLMGDDSTGNPPAGYDVGTLYTDTSVIKNQVKYSFDMMSHGTGTLGCAAGSKTKCKHATYVGSAPKAELAVVDISMFPSTALIVQGVKYLIEYADSVNKPLAINISMGCPYTESASDGESVMDVAIEELLEEHPNGRIIIASAGNDGESKLHCKMELYNNSPFKEKATFTDMSGGYLVFWGTPHIPFSLKLYVSPWSSSNYATDTIEINTTQAIDTVVRRYYGNGYVDVAYVVHPSFYSNQRPMITVGVTRNMTPNNVDFIFTATSNGSTVHCFTNGMTDDYSSNFDSYYTIGSPAACRKVIAVGAYENENKGHLSDFSSKGPLLDGYVKPDITAPGEDVITAKNIFTFWDTNYVDTALNGEYYFSEGSGTSYSSPIVAGIVALMLELNPKLTSDEVLDIIRITAINDFITGDCKDNKSTRWGWGRINAHAIMKQLEMTSIAETNDFEFSISPNPITDGKMYVCVLEDLGTPYLLNIYDVNGKLVYLTTISNDKVIDCSNLLNGVYFVQITNGKQQALMQCVINR